MADGWTRLKLAKARPGGEIYFLLCFQTVKQALWFAWKKKEWWQLRVEEEEGPCPRFVLWMRQKFGDLNSSRTKQTVSAAGLDAAETMGHPVSARSSGLDTLESETAVPGLWGNYSVGYDTELLKVDSCSKKNVFGVRHKDVLGLYDSNSFIKYFYFVQYVIMTIKYYYINY